MRRIDHDGHVARQGPPSFRVLAVPDSAYLSPIITAPPPPRAPEPYKIAPSTTSSGRAHRRSSFVILAESSPASPDPDNAAPNLPTGRVSPFRGRGFKGPPPHSMSRPQSPEIAGDGRRRRIEQKASLSQQNSPRRSLIPQPTYRQRSTSLTKANERSPSPKIGRRVDSKTRLNVSNSQGRLNVSNSQGRLNAADSKTQLNDSRTRLNKSDFKSRTNFVESKTRFISNSTSNLSNNSTTTRRQVTIKASTRLSPIQGTPTKPEKTNSQSNTKNRNSLRPSPTKTSRISPQKNNVTTTRRDNQNRNSSKERVLSPSKIPLKTNGSSNTNRFISMPEQSSERFVKMDKTGKIVTEGRSDKQTANQSLQNGQSSELNPKESKADEGNSPDNMDEMDLINLLKQTSQTTGTSERLVNTTTTTAVQPLHIDANTLLVEPSQKERSEGTSRSISPTSKGESPVPVSMQNTASMHQKPVENQPIKTNQASNNPGNDNKDSSVSVESNTIGHMKSSSIGQSTKVVTKINGEDLAHQHSNQSSATQHSGKNNQNIRASKQSDGKTLGVSETIEVKSSSASSKVAVVTGEIPVNDKMPNVMENDSKIARTAEKAEMAMNNATTVNNTIAMNSKTTSYNNNNVNSAIGAVNASVNSGAVVRSRNENRGSDASLKSSTGASTGSIESVRSTDTGVSVNTVRGVSSPREKTGVHVVKRSQEIETLSGNIVHIEQNGEPTVLASCNEKEQAKANEKLLARWGRSLSRYSKCCSGMRCLACRRDPKSLLWTRNQKRAMVINDTPPPVAPSPATNTLSCWSKLKSRCRCSGLKEIKCCTRKSRVAPSEPTVCCPPERRCGAICRRVFGCCSCKRADTQQRTKNTRAKHSLTSVVPPPLSEEPKAKLPDVLVEYNSIMRGAIPCLPVPLAWFCLIWNVLLPGTGTVWSGLFDLCTGQPRFSPVAGLKSRLGAFIVNLVVGVGQLFTVLFCLVGWGWSIWWGVTMVRLARKYKRFKASEAASNDLEARGGEPGSLPPGVPSQALREVERAR